MIVDPATATAYLMSERREVEAVAIETGKTRWRSKAGERPLWLAGGALLAQGGPQTTSFVVLDAKTGKLQRRCTGWEAPHGIDASMGSSGTVIVHDAGAGKVELHWSTETHYAGGAAPTEDDMRQAASYREGVVAIGLPGCTLTSLREQKLADPMSYRPTTPPALSPVTVVDGTTIELVTTNAADGSGRIVLRRTDASGKSELELARGKAGYVSTSVSPTGRHVITISQDPTSGGNGTFYYDHALYEAATGTRLGAFRSTWHAGGIGVVGKTLIEATSYGVRGVELATGKERWRRPLRLTFYNGPMPP